MHTNDKISYEKPNDPGFEIVPNEVNPEEDAFMIEEAKATVAEVSKKEEKDEK